jgi:hypothetical protein
MFLLNLQAMTGHHHMQGMSGGGQQMADELSLFNHHFAGWLLVVTAGFGTLEESPLQERRWVRYLWPMPLIFLAFYLLLRSDSEYLRSLAPSHILASQEALQHKLAALLALSIGVIELLRRAGKIEHPGWSYILYGGMVAGGIFLLFHGGHHSDGVHQQHLLMGITAIAIGATKALGDLFPAQSWLRFAALPGLFLALGLELVRYWE